MLLRVEPHFGKHAQHVRGQRCRGMNRIERAGLETEWPEEQGRMARSPLRPPPDRQAVGSSVEREGGRRYAVLPVQAAGATGMASDGSHRVSRLSRSMSKTQRYSPSAPIMMPSRQRKAKWGNEISEILRRPFFMAVWQPHHDHGEATPVMPYKSEQRHANPPCPILRSRLL